MMSIVYASFEVQFHSLDIRSTDELDKLRLYIRKLLDAGVSEIDGRVRCTTNDIEVGLLEAVGDPERCAAVG